MSKDIYAKYASRAERQLDELWEAHLNYQCQWETCSWCIADEVEQMSDYYAQQEDDRACRHCGSTEIERNGEIERCAVCGR